MLSEYYQFYLEKKMTFIYAIKKSFNKLI